MKKLLVYYGWPSMINYAAGNTLKAAAHLNLYDTVLLGANLELPQHPEHEAVRQIIRCLDAAVYGYIDLGVTTSGHSPEELGSRISGWMYLGAVGVMWDDAGRDYGVSPTRLWAAVGAAHDRGMACCVNCWDPDDLIGSGLTVGDSYLAESFRIRDSRRDLGWRRRGRHIGQVQRRLGFNVWALPTGTYTPRRWDKAILAAQEWRFGTFGWGEPDYCADSRAPNRWEQT